MLLGWLSAVFHALDHARPTAWILAATSIQLARSLAQRCAAASLAGKLAAFLSEEGAVADEDEEAAEAEALPGDDTVDATADEEANAAAAAAAFSIQAL